MNKVLSIILLSLAILGCSKDDFTPDVEAYQVNVQLIIPDEVVNDLDTLSGISVVLYNENKDYSLTVETDTEGNFECRNLEAGAYRVSLSYQKLLDDMTLVLNASGELLVTNDFEDSLQVSYNYMKDGNFVIREYYFTGCLTPAGNNYFDDQFIDIYNNSTDTLFADKLLLLELESYGTSPNFWGYMQSDFIVVKMVWQVPGSGTDYPIPPGDGFVVARDALNHHSDPNGNPNSPVDLANAEFEFWSDFRAIDIDYAATNMVEKWWSYKGNDVVMHVKGGSAIAIARMDGDVDAYIQNNLVTKGTPTSRSTYFCRMAISSVIDAVEVTFPGVFYDRMDDSLDAGNTFLEAGSKSGLSVRRKIKRLINGYPVYQDTNNSTYDFEHDVVPMPGVYAVIE